VAAPAPSVASAASASAPPKFYVPAPGAPPPPASSLGLGKPAAKPSTAKVSDGAARGPAPSRPEPSRPAGPPKRRRVRRRILQALAVLVLVPLVLIGAGLVWAQHKFSQIERVQVSEVLDPQVGDGLNILMVGSDEGADRTGQRSDTIMLMRLEPDRSLVMSIPRDLFVQIAGTDRQQRINAAYNDGPATLIQTIQQDLGLPIHRYMEVDFVTFAALVDSIGGVTIEFPHPVIDEKSGLTIGQTGPVLLNGAQALAYVRSRQYTEIIDGRQVIDPRGDLGRVERQQTFMRTLFGKIGESRNPFRLMDIGSSLVGGLRIDDDMSLLDAIRLALRLDDLQPESVVLPTFPFQTDAGAQVLGLDEDGAEAALEQFR
jgi:LCP family protein required for cell wall assembly